MDHGLREGLLAQRARQTRKAAGRNGNGNGNGNGNAATRKNAKATASRQRV
jgi:hypothetical protein